MDLSLKHHSSSANTITMHVALKNGCALLVTQRFFHWSAEKGSDLWKNGFVQNSAVFKQT